MTHIASPTASRCHRPVCPVSVSMNVFDFSHSSAFGGLWTVRPLVITRRELMPFTTFLLQISSRVKETRTTHRTVASRGHGMFRFGHRAINQTPSSIVRVGTACTTTTPHISQNNQINVNLPNLLPIHSSQRGTITRLCWSTQHVQAVGINFDLIGKPQHHLRAYVNCDLILLVNNYLLTIDIYEVSSEFSYAQV